MFKANTYINRRNTLKSKIQSGLILLLGNNESSMNFKDNTYHFRQDSTFLYYFGLNKPGLVGIIDVDENIDYIFGDDLSIDHIVWMGYQETVEVQAKTSGIENCGSLTELTKLLKHKKNENRTIHFLPPYRPENLIFTNDLLDRSPNSIKSSSSIELIKAIVSMREIKSNEEVSEIEIAVNTSVDMHKKAMSMVRPGLKESQIAAAVHEIAIAHGGNLSFPIIATVHGETLHNHYHGNTLNEGDLFLLDCGAETAMGYAGDLSSTMAVSKKFTNIQRDVYQIALASHESAVKLLKPGVPFIDVYYKSAEVIVDGMKDLGLMRGNTQEILNAGAHGMFFPCGLGHQMGLDVHDMENLGEQYVGYDGAEKSKEFGLKSLRLGKKLKEGMVITIEPGIYFIPALMDLWKKENKNSQFINYEKLDSFRTFGGIRNEEDFLITDSSYRLLGKKKPKTIDEINEQREH